MKKLMDKFGKKKVYAGIGGVAVLAIAIIIGTVYMINENKEKLMIKEEVVKIELGKEVSVKPSDYLSDEMSKENISSTTLKSDLLTDTEKYVVDKEKQTVISKDKEYLAVGEYKVTLSLNKEVKDVTLQVVDTTAPVFKDLKKEIKVEQNAEDVDFTKYFKAEDLSKVKITVNDKKVDLAKTGKYELEVTAKDAYDNKTTKTTKVVVVDADKADEVTETNDGEKPISAETKQKQEEQAEEEQQQQANAGGNTNTSGGSSGGSTNGGENSGGGSTLAPAPQPNGIGAVINTAYSYVGRTDMTCSDMVKQAFQSNGYDVPSGLSYYIGYSVGNDASVLQAGDLLFLPNHVMLVASVSGNNITAIEGGINGTNVMVRNHVVGGNQIVIEGIGSATTITDIRRV